MPILIITMFAALLMAEFAHKNADQWLSKMLTEGNAAFSVRTATYNGPYAPRNAGAIWITDSNNQFVKTIKKWASNYQYTLVRWIASSGQNTTGAITSASLNSHVLHNVQWNGKNWQNQDMPDGDYKFNVEFTEHNASAANMGKFKQVVFTKGPQPVQLTPPNETYFRDMNLTWTPVIQNGTLSGTVTGIGGAPIPAALITIGALSQVTDAAGFYSFSLQPGSYNLLCQAPGYLDYSVENIAVASSETTTQNISLSPVGNSDIHNAIPQVIFSTSYPNPTNSSAKMDFYSSQSLPYTIKIYDIRGRHLKTILSTSSSKGWNSTVWDLQDKNGNRCSSGTYTAILQIGGKRYPQKLSIIN